FFRLYKERHPGPLALALVGPVAVSIPEDEDVIVTGVVSEADKWDLVRDAQVAISPSALESFSLVVLEAWEKSVPVIVNATCEPTREHCQRSGGGLWFGSFREFEVVLERLCADAALRQLLGHRGHAYVETYYQWPAVIRRYARFLTTVTERGPRWTRADT
ncbi:MAG TPA: glycosyltransferase, partial [Acidimicrobiales bacterium]